MPLRRKKKKNNKEVKKIQILKQKTIAVLTIIIVAIALTATFYAIPILSSSHNIEEKSLLAIKQIIGLDLNKYEVNFSSRTINMSSPVSSIFADYNGSKVEDVSCKLYSDDSNLSVNMRFINGSLWGVNLYPYNFSLLSAHYNNQLPTDPLDATRILLQRIQKYYEDSSYTKRMLDSLQTVNRLEQFNSTIEDMTRQVMVYNELVQVNRTINYTSTSTSISFMYTFGEASASAKGVVFGFKDGALKSFSNGWELFKVGSETLVVSREQAISIAMEQLKNASSAEIKLRNESIKADLTLVRREPFKLHPFWFVDLPLATRSQSTSNNPTYVHGFTEWQVGIWADTGKIEYSHPA